jgi:type IV secretion system protein VirD4
LGQRPGTVYLAWPEHLVHSGARPLALILHGLITGLVRAADRRGFQVPTVLVLDEAPQYRVPALPSYAATLLGRGVAVMTFVQSEAQLRAGYREEAVTIADNARAKLYLQPDDEVARTLSAALGHRTVTRWRRQQGPQGLSRLRLEEKRELLTPDEVTRLGSDEAILRYRGLPPVRGRRLLWYRDRALKKRLAPQIDPKD